MKNTLRKISLLLALLMLVSVFAACKRDGEDTDDGNKGDGEVGTDMYDPKLPAADFDNYTFTYAARGDGSKLLYDATDLVVDELSNDLVNDAIYKRNTEICNRYNFQLEVEYVGSVVGKTSGSEMSQYIERCIMSGDTRYDAIVSETRETIGFSMKEWTIDLYGVENLNLEQPWWDQSVARDLTIGNKVYMATGDIMTGDKKGVITTVFNKTLSADLGLEDHYAVVDAGNWTLEKFYENSHKAAADLTGDSYISSPDDRYGYLYWQDAMQNFISGTGNAIGRVMYGGVFEVTIANEKMINIWDKMTEFLNSDSAYSAWNNKADHKEDYITALNKMMGTGKALYAYASVAYITEMRALDADIGILPNPKADTEQTEYMSAVTPWGVNFISIPITNTDTARTGHILEALAAKGRELIRPAYYDVNLLTRSAKDVESSKILDILFETRVYDIGACLSWGDLPQGIINLFNSGNKNLARTVETYSKETNADIETQMKMFGLK